MSIKRLFGKKNHEALMFEQLKQSLSTDDGNLLFAGRLLEKAYKRFPNKPALITAQKTLTYREFYFRTILLGKTLTQHNVGPRDRVILFYENSIEFFIAYFAIWQLGAVVVPINIFLHERELAHIINDSTPKLIFTSPTLRPKLDALITEKHLESLPPILGNDAIDWHMPTPKRVEDLFPDFVVTNLAPHELCVLLYTSGTTGIPKGVMLSSNNIMINVLQGYARFSANGMTPDERFFCVLPLFHVFAQNTCLWLPILIGSSIIIVPKIDRSLILDGLKLKPTLFFGFPALYGLLCLMKTAPLDSIKFFISGADMLPDKIAAAFSIIYGRRICAGYGLSEAAPVVAVNLENATQSTKVVGHPLPGLLCDIRDPEGRSLNNNTTGTLWLKGDNIMMGYYNTPDATAQILIDGWLNTGDLAQKDDAGQLTISGRIKDIIIHKGFNIYPAEIENILLLHPAVFKAAVIGIDDPAAGQTPIALVAAKNLDANLANNLRILCAQHLAAYKIPRKFVCLEDLPMNQTGKVDKKKIAKDFLNHHRDTVS